MRPAYSLPVFLRTPLQVFPDADFQKHCHGSTHCFKCNWVHAQTITWRQNLIHRPIFLTITNAYFNINQRSTTPSRFFTTAMIYHNSEDPQIKYELNVYLKSTKKSPWKCKSHPGWVFSLDFHNPPAWGALFCVHRGLHSSKWGGHVAAAHWGPHVHGVKEGHELYLAVVPTDTQSGQGTRAEGNKSALGG